MKNQKEKFYRFVVNDVGIYEAVERDCSKEDLRRKNKPDGLWLSKKGLEYPDAISFWSENGFKKYQNSGLMRWHISVVKEKVEVFVIDRPEEVLYEDEYQIICKPEVMKEAKRVPLGNFMNKEK